MPEPDAPGDHDHRGDGAGGEHQRVSDPMTTATLYAPPRPTFSFELYPPRTAAGQATAWETVRRLTQLRPDFFSVTYGASGSRADASLDLVRRVLTETETTVMAHLTCVGMTHHQARAMVEGFIDDGVRNFLALRGDPPAGQSDWAPGPGELGRASDLVRVIREVETERFGPRERAAVGAPVVSIAVAAYPAIAVADGEGLAVRDGDLAALVDKQAAGADFAITQLFFEVEAYAELIRRARAAGVAIPLLPGILPLTDPARIRRVCDLSGLPQPAALLAELDSLADPDARYRRGIEATLDLVRGVIAAGAPGAHIYTFNRHEAAAELVERANGQLAQP